MDLKDKIPPQAIEIEESILGTIILYSQQIPTVLEYLKPESFYKQIHQLLFSIILTKYNKNENIDLLTISEAVKYKENLTLLEITELCNKVTTWVNLETHCQIVAERFIKRELIRIGNELIKKGFDDNEDFSDIIDFNNGELMKITSQFTVNSLERIDSAINTKMKEIESVSMQKNILLGIPTNIQSIDFKTCGFQAPDLVIIGARPSVGKTAFALKIAKEASIAGFPTCMFSLEMSTGQLALRLIASVSEYTQMELKTGRVNDWTGLEKGIKKFDNLPLYIDDKAALSISQMKSRIISYIQKYKIKLVIIDYLQLMRGFGTERNREAEVANISKSLKTFAKEFNICVIALCQLNRTLETRSEKKPMVSDLRESGQIEQDADMIIFLRRDEMYFEEQELKGKMQIDFAKYRNGSVGEVVLNYSEGMTDFADLDFDFKNKLTNDVF